MGDLTFTAVVIMVSLKMQLLEMHNKSIMAGLSIFLSIGGWFLWNIILSATYSNNKIYYVKDALFHRFGRNGLWWLVLLLIMVSLLAFEVAVSAIRVTIDSTFGIGDVDANTFQALEKDPFCKRRFEEAAAPELQQGWDRGAKKSSMELRREEEEERLKLEEEERREVEVKEMLKNRPDAEEWQQQASVTTKTAEGATSTANGQQPERRRSLEIQEMLKRGFGSVRR